MIESQVAEVVRPRAIIFDWDNTLVDTFPVIREALNATLVEFGHTPWSIEETHQRVRRSMRDSFPELFGDEWERAGTYFYEKFDDLHLEKLTMMDGATELLGGLAASDIYLAVVSNKRGDFLRSEVEHLGWEGYFGAVVGANDAARDKPARDPVDLALGKSQVPAGRDVWFVGDADIDVHCARNANCTSVLISKTTGAGDTHPEAPADISFPNCMALSNFIDKL